MTEVNHLRSGGNREPVLFLHGFTGSSLTWHDMTELIPCHAVTPDIAGHAGSKRMPVSLEQEAKEWKQFMNDEGFDSFHVVGYSMGGRLALAMALLFPESICSLVLESASPGLKTEKERAERRASDEKLAQQIEQEGMESFINYWENMPMFESQKSLPESIRRQVRYERMDQSEKGIASSLRGMGTGSQSSYWHRLHELTMPVLLLTGTLDLKFTNIARCMKTIIPNCKWIEFDGAGHALHVEQREKFGTIVKTFFFDMKGRQF
ncbi:2-succinyl-6-hydroxy-2,4-cyclohexadiene-1-carboxylate synthase [Domibacillus mangrovi]|uniref:Putative 2-succinyl-6-hydroxy-2,4-cyclohexadiene-1-carboxylate synthase n=1 Tax=Domibacillus mangrovi TaxID=1714354 RepID=A0A1Q5P1N4_9BACI|nr:2-succinyl-6-hydroxy-2,4-cyclohexadiene-1-carboxylate synthase [Domibacillus mangrovi]OKL36174.1 2-succinyl-6-hydroxy-2,4-cyclohexadiene-1-carboxylate synthase [Domibacillus mangrovi]